MTETKFTPGPWAHFDSPAARDIFNGCSVIISHHIDDAIIATIGEDVPNHEGNARLIAAAPDLYAALQAVQLQLLQSNNDSEYAQQANELACAALTKAVR